MDNADAGEHNDAKKLRNTKTEAVFVLWMTSERKYRGTACAREEWESRAIGGHMGNHYDS